MINDTKFGKMVKTLREQAGLSQMQLANTLGWKQSSLSRLEKGLRKKVAITEVDKICKVLQVSVEDLFAEPYYSTEKVTLYEGDAEFALLNLDDNSVDCVVTSPPYYGLRDYEISNQIGLEEHPAQYVERLVRVFRQIKRVLKPTGSLWVNIGDTFWSGKGQSQGVDTKQKHRRFTRPQDRLGEPPLCVPKQRLLIPHRLAIALQEDGWILRGDNVWFKPNPIPDPVSDRCAIAHEYVFHFVKQRKYYFDSAAVALPSNGDKKTKPPQSVWVVQLSHSSKAHKAVFPEELVRLPIRATCPPEGTLLDPFCGSGTALYVALQENQGNKVIGIDLSKTALKEAKNSFAHMQLKNI
jgi:site-specific DNA-methyltransferase (cytosine-N4-specific)